MDSEVAVGFADLERQAAELLAGFATMEGRNSASALAASVRRDSEETRRRNSTPSSAGSERVRSPEFDGAGQGAFFPPPVSASVDQRSLISEQFQRLNIDRSAPDVRTKLGAKEPPVVQGSADRETKKVLKKLANKWSRYADSFGACKHIVYFLWCMFLCGMLHCISLCVCVCACVCCPILSYPIVT